MVMLGILVRCYKAHERKQRKGQSRVTTVGCEDRGEAKSD